MNRRGAPSHEHQMKQPELFAAAAGRIGTDESGKGDYFGPLVVAGFYLEDAQEAVLRELGVRDSKTLSDRRCLQIAETLQAGYPHSVVAVGPEKYNELYAKMRNLNKLLAWGHARVIENLLERVPCVRAVTDQFGDAKFVLNALLKKGRAIELVQRPRGEEDAAVAAASILARAEFLKKLKLLGWEWGMNLPKGAGPQVELAAITFVRSHGPEALAKVAKMHFKTTERVLKAV
jgi:ribonuclease HIII